LIHSSLGTPVIDFVMGQTRVEPSGHSATEALRTTFLN
jgi:hypothetical protein